MFIKIKKSNKIKKSLNELTITLEHILMWKKVVKKE